MIGLDGMAGEFTIKEDDLSSQQVRGLLALHLAGMRANSPPENVFALDLSGLQRPEVTVWTAWEGEKLAGIAALRRLPEGGEIKSMRTHPAYLQKGVASRLLAFVMAQAAAAGIKTLYLETGTGPAFEPALALYRKHGFSACPAFGDYQENAFSQFLKLHLGPG
jgi:putative acetyltransferase